MLCYTWCLPGHTLVATGAGRVQVRARTLPQFGGHREAPGGVTDEVPPP